MTGTFGPDYVAGRDSGRLMAQMNRIAEFMADGVWRTLPQISAATNDPPASVSAQLRHLRKPKFGGHTVEKRYIKNGLYEYRLVLKDPEAECAE